MCDKVFSRAQYQAATWSERGIVRFSFIPHSELLILKDRFNQAL